jgi:hypothetical protein
MQGASPSSGPRHRPRSPVRITDPVSRAVIQANRAKRRVHEIVLRPLRTAISKVRTALRTLVQPKMVEGVIEVIGAGTVVDFFSRIRHSSRLRQSLKRQIILPSGPRQNEITRGRRPYGHQRRNTQRDVQELGLELVAAR